MIRIVIEVVLIILAFGAGRVKNAAKLAAVKAELAKIEASAVAEVKALAADIKKKL